MQIRVLENDDLCIPDSRNNIPSFINFCLIYMKRFLTSALIRIQLIPKNSIDSQEAHCSIYFKNNPILYKGIFGCLEVVEGRKIEVNRSNFQK